MTARVTFVYKTWEQHECLRLAFPAAKMMFYLEPLSDKMACEIATALDESLSGRSLQVCDHLPLQVWHIGKQPIKDGLTLTFTYEISSTEDVYQPILSQICDHPAVLVSDR